MFQVYVLKSKNFDKSYVGSTNNLDRRIKEHNSGKHNFTKKFMPWKIIYTEQYTSESEARRREKFLKTTPGRRFLKKIFKNL